MRYNIFCCLFFVWFLQFPFLKKVFSSFQIAVNPLQEYKENQPKNCNIPETNKPGMKSYSTILQQ